MNAQATLNALTQSERIGRLIYKGFNERKLDLWDDVIAADVELRSTVGSQPIYGIEPLKNWAAEFQTQFSPRLDLVDEIYGVNRAVIAVNLIWKHTGEFFGLAPTGRKGTSIEYFILSHDGEKVTRFWVADHTLDLATYLIAERGMHYPQNFEPQPIIRGIEVA
ncbi:MAG: ester cyclase [Cyanobacteria bacterium P01_H01_bin.15]